LYAKDKKNVDKLPLLNTKWVLKEILEIPVFQTSDTAFIIFEENFRVLGNFGCNLFFGEFNFWKRRIKIDFKGATKKYCADMQLEEQFSKVIRNEITHYYINNNELFLLYQNKVVCRFEGSIKN
jgi:heat shock protein HslJ